MSRFLRVPAWTACTFLGTAIATAAPPIANPDKLVIPPNAAVEIPVLLNDSDADKDVLNLVSITQPAHGSAVILSGPRRVIRYQPLAGFIDDTDSFTYTMSDGTNNATASVSIRVEAYSTPGPVPAFPGAEGPGAITSHGRGGDVYFVDRLEDDNQPGSLRWAVAQPGKRIIVFRIGGTVHLKSRLNIDHPWLCIAGQTAPGGGITLAGSPNTLPPPTCCPGPETCPDPLPGSLGNAALIWVRTHDVCIRYIRLRGGQQGVPICWSGNGQGAIQARGQNLIFDHLSISWNHDDNAAYINHVNFNGNSLGGFGFPIYNQTWQRCIFGEPLLGQPTGFLVGGSRNMYSTDHQGNKTGTPFNMGRYVSDIAFHHNLFAHVSHRSPLGISRRTRLINNYVYNWRYFAGGTLADSEWDIRNNYYRPGPMTLATPGWAYLVHEGNSQFDLTRLHHLNSPVSGLPPSIYVNNNIFCPTSKPIPAPVGDNWNNIGQQHDSCCWEQGDPLPSEWRRLTPLPDDHFPITMEAANNARWSVLADVGANRELTETGALILRQDPVDARLINDAKNGFGPTVPPTSETEVGGYPDLQPGTPYADIDNDGMADVWERNNGLVVPYNDSKADNDLDGYTNVEEFLNSTPP